MLRQLISSRGDDDGKSEPLHPRTLSRARPLAGGTCSARPSRTQRGAHEGNWRREVESRAPDAQYDAAESRCGQATSHDFSVFVGSWRRETVLKGETCADGRSYRLALLNRTPHGVGGAGAMTRSTRAEPSPGRVDRAVTRS